MKYSTDIRESKNGTRIIGCVRAPHGTAGALSVASFSGEWKHFTTLEHCVLLKDKVELECQVSCQHANNFNIVLKFHGINTIEDARTWHKALILVDEQYASPLFPNEFYISDVIHSVLIHEHSAVGTLTNIIESGNCDLFEVQCKNTGEHKLVPFIEHFIGKIDIQNKKIELKHAWILE